MAVTLDEQSPPRPEIEADPDYPAVSLRPPWTLAAVVGGAFVLWGLVIGLGPIADNGFLTHLATGRLILLDGIPTTDPYSYTAPGAPWVVQSWLASVVYAGVERWGGFAALRVLMGLCTAAIALLAWRLTAPARSLLVRIAAVALVVGIGTATWTPRPLLFGLVFLGVSLLVADRQLPAWLLLPVYWLWVNLHGSFPLGLVALACLALGTRLDGRRPRAELEALAWGVGGTLLGAVNPLGPTLLTFPIHMLDRQSLLANIIEWQSPAFSLLWTRLFLLLLALAIAALARRPSWRAAVPMVVFVAATLLAVRNMALASIVLLPGIAHGLRGLGSLDGLRRSRVATVGVVLMVALGLVATSAELRRTDLELDDFPVDAVAWLDQQGLVGPGTERHLATNDITGNYLELLYGPDARAFLDDRLDMYPASVVNDFLTMRDGRPGWQAAMDRRDVDALLWPSKSGLAQVLREDPRWRVAYQDTHWVVFLPSGT